MRKKIIVVKKKGGEEKITSIPLGRVAASVATAALAPEDRMRLRDADVAFRRRLNAEDLWSASFTGDSGGDRRGRIRYL